MLLSLPHDSWIGKGIREAPRDALVADIVPHHLRGASYGLRQSLDTVGALCGPLAATLVMAHHPNDFRLVFWIAVVPAFLSVGVLAFFVKEPARTVSEQRAVAKIHWRELREFPTTFWWVVFVGAIFTLARFSEAFLVLRARDLGMGIGHVPLVMVMMNIVYSASAYPAGHLSDRIDRRALLAAGAAVLFTADIVLGASTGLKGLLAGIGLWGLHLGLTQGLFAALVADAAPVEHRGTAFGLFNAVSGGVLLLASIVAGELWDRAGASATFYAGAGFAATALIALLVQIQRTNWPTVSGSPARP
jgi:MFS family permease